MTRQRLISNDRAWRKVVFGRAMYAGVLGWLGVSLLGFLLAGVPALTAASSLILNYVMPAGFTAIAWLTASSFLLTAGASAARREWGSAAWMAVWTLVLAWTGAAGVRWMSGGAIVGAPLD